MTLLEFTASLFSGGGAAYGLGWLASRKKNAAELEGARLKNLETTIEIYEKVHEELKDQIDALRGEINQFRKENVGLKEEMSKLRQENAALKNEIHILNERLKQTTS